LKGFDQFACAGAARTDGRGDHSPRRGTAVSAPVPGWRAAIRRLRAGLIVLALAIMAGDAGAAPNGGAIITSHGYAVFGQLAYGPEFRHFAYADPDAPKGGTYRYAAGTTFDSLNPFALVGTYPLTMLHAYDTLMTRSLDEPASYYGLIAGSITYPADFSWVEFRLRPEARWHDGRPITPEDVIFTVETFRNPLINAQYRRATQAIRTVRKTGAGRVRMELVQAGNPTLPAVVAAMPVIPRHFFAGRDFTAPTLGPMLASGPYRLGKLVPGRSVDLERVADYWGRDLPVNRGRHNFGRIRHLFYRDVTLQNEAFLAGLVDLRFEGSATRWEYEAGTPAFASGDIRRRLIRYDQGVFFNSLQINTRRPFLASRQVREALELAYDHEWVKRVVLDGHHGRTESYFDNTEFAARGLPGADELALLEPFRRSLPADVFERPLGLPIGGTRARQRANLQRARQLLLEAGYRYRGMRLVDPASGRPVRLELSGYSGIVAINTAQFIRNLQRLGIDAFFRNYDTAQFRQKVDQYDFDLMAPPPFFPPNPAPGVELRAVWSSVSAQDPNTRNYAGIADPAIDAAVERVIAATDRREVVTAMRVIDRIARHNYYAIPFQHTYPAEVGRMPVTYWNRFGHPASEPTYNFPFMTMDHWWWDPAKEAALTSGSYK
jgi:microcin C transport system substrate-binding protein